MTRFLATLRDSAMCWPTLTVQVHVPPWHWRFVPYVYLDSTHGWWGVDVAWLMVEVALGWNRPAFTWESP